MNYSEFLSTKTFVAPQAGIAIDPSRLHPSLFPFQADLVRWSLRKGRAAIFAATGMGKTLIQLCCADLSGEPSLIVAPLSVAQQTVREGDKFGIPVQYVRHPSEITSRLSITNYEMIGHFAPSAFGTVVLDESSRLKGLDSRTRVTLTEMFHDTPFRFCFTATPAPNDVAELSEHAEFLGIMSRAEMMAMFFTHDDDGWRLRGHAHDAFYRWLASWGMSVRKPSDLGHSDDGFDLPPLTIHKEVVVSNYAPPDQLFFTGLKGITDRSNVRKATVAQRIDRAIEIVQAEPHEPWLIWCGLNSEQDQMAKRLGPRCVSIYGSLPIEEKVRREAIWREGRVPILVSKASVFGHGMNWQHCARMIWVGLNDSFEAWFQGIRRCWRYNQTRAVHVYAVISDAEEGVYQNVRAKEAEAERMSNELVKHVAAFERAEIGRGYLDRDDYVASVAMRLPAWLNPPATIDPLRLSLEQKHEVYA